MRDLSILVLFLGVVFWGLAFYRGPESSAWSLGKPGIFLMALSAVLYLAEFLIPAAKPRRRHRARSETARKCSICGKPALGGSRFCSYHAKYGEGNKAL